MKYCYFVPPIGVRVLRGFEQRANLETWPLYADWRIPAKKFQCIRLVAWWSMSESTRLTDQIMGLPLIAIPVLMVLTFRKVQQQLFMQEVHR